MGNANVTARLDPETKEKLDLLAKSTARSKSFLISEAVRAYVKEQAWQINAIQAGVEQANAGNFASNDEIRSTFGKWGVDVVQKN
ncbi:MAG: CopG family ribbon-helix-helix protein [Pseudomonadota bacterium]